MVDRSTVDAGLNGYDQPARVARYPLARGSFFLMLLRQIQDCRT
jgi:hypothetical protein